MKICVNNHFMSIWNPDFTSERPHPWAWVEWYWPSPVAAPSTTRVPRLPPWAPPQLPQGCLAAQRWAPHLSPSASWPLASLSELTPAFREKHHLAKILWLFHFFEVSISTPSHLSKHLPNKDGSPHIKGIPGFSSDVKLFSPSSSPTHDEVPSRNGTTKLDYINPSHKRSIFLSHLSSFPLLSVLLGASDRHKDSCLHLPSPGAWPHWVFPWIQKSLPSPYPAIACWHRNHLPCQTGKAFYNNGLE